MIIKVISGGQTGADLGALRGASFCSVETGGWAPKGWKTEEGPDPGLGYVYGLRQHPEEGYPPRTEANVRDSDFTVWMGKMHTPGYKCTFNACVKYKKPFFTVSKNYSIEDVNKFMIYTIGKELVMNFAGNRESSNPGIQVAAESFVTDILKGLNDNV